MRPLPRWARERRVEELTEPAEADALPRLIRSRCHQDRHAAGLPHHLETGTAERATDLEDAERRPVHEVRRPVLQHPRRVPHALAARQRPARAQGTPLGDRAASAGALAAPDGLSGAGRHDAIVEALEDAEATELLAGEVNEGGHQLTALNVGRGCGRSSACAARRSMSCARGSAARSAS